MINKFLMKSKIEIENKLFDLYYELDKLKNDQIHGWANNTLDIEKTLSKIKALEWVLNK